MVRQRCGEDKIEDEQILIDIYNNTKDYKIKKNVIMHIDNPIFLAKVAKDSNEGIMTREVAASRITSQKTLRDIAINAPRQVGIAAVDNPHLKKDTYLYEYYPENRDYLLVIFYKNHTG